MSNIPTARRAFIALPSYGRGPAREEEVDEVEDVGDVGGGVAVHARAAQRRRTSREEVVDEVEDVADVDGPVAVRVALRLDLDGSEVALRPDRALHAPLIADERCACIVEASAGRAT